MVAENRISGTGRQVPIRVVVIPATGPDRQPDPIVYFAGGPGDSAVDDLPSVAVLFAMNPDRDLVFIDQRGTGASKLTCADFPGLADKTALKAVVTACLSSLDADLRFYTTAMFVDDVEQVLSALHYGTVNLVGASYGATAEQVFLIRHPQQVRTMTLLSGTLLSVPLFERYPENAQRALDGVFRECESQPACRDSFPDLNADWSALWSSVTRSPWVIPATRSPTHQQIVIDADWVASQVHRLLTSTRTQADIPVLVHTLGQTSDRVSALLAITAAMPPTANATDPAGAANAIHTANATDPAGAGSQMLAYVTRCAEPWALDRPDRLIGAGSFEYHSDVAYARWLQYFCPLLPRPGPAAGSEQLTPSRVPVLAVNGDEDPQDPPANMAGARTIWPGSLTLAVPGQGHEFDNAAGTCEIPLVDTFIEQGGTAHLDTGCMSRLSPPSFVTSLQAVRNP